MRIVTLVAGLVSVGALAQGASPSVAPFPLEIVRPANLSEKQREELQAAYKVVLRRSGALLPDGAKQAAALKELKRGDCDRDDECLAQLARLSGTLYAVFASVDLTAEGNVVAFGRVVRDDGQRVAELGKGGEVKLPKGKDSFSTLVPVALTQLFSALKVAELPLAKEATPVKPPEEATPPKETPKETPPPPPPVVTPKGPSGVRVAGWTMVGVGAGAAVAGAIVFATAGAVDKDENGYVKDPSQFSRARSQQTAGLVVLSAGAAIAIAGAVTLLVAPDDSAGVKNLTAVPVAGGAVLMLGGNF